MNAEVRRMWVNGLISDEYQQGKNNLRAENNGIQEYCCLGVLADLYIKETGKGKWVKGNLLGISTLAIGDVGDSCELLSEVLDWADLKCGEQNELIMMNDHRNKNFNQIANYIKENL